MKDLTKLMIIYLVNLIISSGLTIYIKINYHYFEGWELFIFTFVFVNIIYLVSLIKNNSSYIDFYWSTQGLFLVILYIMFFILKNPFKFEIISKRLETYIPFMLVCLYSFRHAYIYFKNFTVMKEDFRYLDFKKKMPNPIVYQIFNYLNLHLAGNFIEFFGMYPAFDLVNFLWNNYINDENYYPYSSILHKFLFYYGFLVSYIGLILETVADEQLNEFREKKEKNQYNLDHKVMRTGVWRFSRHPNYLGEMVFYTGLFIANIAVNGISICNSIGIILIYSLFCFYSVPAMEELLLSKYGEEYRRYQEQVGVFFPMNFHKKLKNY
jgi:steroid 5-alpha reductase family enzyme